MQKKVFISGWMLLLLTKLSIQSAQIIYETTKKKLQ